MGLVIVIVVVGGLIGGLVYLQSISSSTSTHTQTGILNETISSSLYQDLISVSPSTLNAVGNGGSNVQPLVPISPPDPISNNGKPEILYIGAEFCPLCAADRWGMIVALSQFGNFSGLEYMQSSSSDAYPNTATFSFLNARYSSSYINLVTVENEDRNHATLQAPNATEQQLWSTYNPNAYPFIDIGGYYLIKTAQFNPQDLAGLNWTQIASQLNNPSSTVAKDVDGLANRIITAICSIDGGKPSSVCSQSFANVSFDLPAYSGLAQMTQNLIAVQAPAIRIGKSSF